MNETLPAELTVEWAPFQLAEHVNESTLLEAATAIENEFLSRQYGYLRRELLKGKQGRWVDLVYWSSAHSAAQAMEAAKDCDACNRYFSLMQLDGDSTEAPSHYTRVASWQ